MVDAGFWSINFGNTLTIFAFIVGGIMFVTTVRGRVDGLAERMIKVETSLTSLVDVLIKQGRHDERMAAIDQRLHAQGQRIDTLSDRFNRTINGIHEKSDE